MINVRYAGLPTRIICKAPRVKRNLDKLLKNVTQLNSVYLKVYKITLTSKYRRVTTRKKNTRGSLIQCIRFRLKIVLPHCWVCNLLEMGYWACRANCWVRITSMSWFNEHGDKISLSYGRIAFSIFMTNSCIEVPNWYFSQAPKTTYGGDMVRNTMLVTYSVINILN